MAYVGGYFVQQQHARQQRRPTIARGAPPAHPTTRQPSAPTSPVALAAAQRQTPAPPAPASVPVVAGGYFGVDARGQVIAASARGAALVIGPPESGKTQSVIMPSVAYAPGAVVSTSMKAEVLAATHVARSLRGKCWLFDPGGSMVPAGVIGLRWNPLCDITDCSSTTQPGYSYHTHRTPVLSIADITGIRPAKASTTARAAGT